jgi:hypothetical protein
LKELYSSSLLQQVVTGEQATRILNSNLQRTVENMQAQLDAFSRQVDLLTDSPSRRGQKSSSPAGVAPGAVMLVVAKVESARSAGIPAPPELKRKSNIAPAMLPISVLLTPLLLMLHLRAKKTFRFRVFLARSTMMDSSSVKSLSFYVARSPR